MSEQQLILGRHARFLRGNTHTHTTRSDGQLSPEHTSRWYDENNYDFLVLTDHTIAPWDRRITTVEDDPRLILLGGAEFHPGFTRHGDRWHIIAACVPAGFDARPFDEDPRGLIDALRVVGAWICIAHPHAQGLDADDVRTLGMVDAVEIYNERSLWWDEKPDGWYLVDDLASKGTLVGAIAADDAHFDGRPDHGRAWVMVDAKNSAPAILTALHSRDYYATQGPNFTRISRNPTHLFVECDPVHVITLGGLGQKAQTYVGEDITTADFDLSAHIGSYVRITIRDHNGSRAWSNLIHV